MNDYQKQQKSDRESKEPLARQPNRPGDCKPDPDTDDCKSETGATKPQVMPVYEPKPPCDPPPEDCHCKKKLDSDSGSEKCIVDLIAAQQAAITAAEQAKTFKTKLEAMLTKAQAAAQEYTPDKYHKLLKQWHEADCVIAELVRKLECALPCWKCAIECYICPSINVVHAAEAWLYGDGKLPTEAHNIYDQRYWLERDLDQKTKKLQRIESVMTTWEKPAQVIEKALADNAKLTSECNKLLETPTKIVYDVFLKLVPLHLAIAPPVNPDDNSTHTHIQSKYTEFCGCDTLSVDKWASCCGPNVGEMTLQQRLIGVQPYLIDPSAYYTLVCCLITNHHAPASASVAIAQAELEKKNNEIAGYKKVVEDFSKGSLDKIWKASIPSNFMCDDCESKDTGQKASRSF